MKMKKSVSHQNNENQREEILNKWWIIGLLSFSIILFVAVVFGIGNDNYIYSSYDFREIFTYQKSYFAKALQEGRFPLWNPHTFSGGPFAANPLVQAFYPPSLLYLILSQPKAVVLNYILHLLFGVAGMYLHLRLTFHLGRGGAAFGAMLFALSGSIVGHAFAGHIQFYAAAMYLPFLMLSVDQIILTLSQSETSKKRSRFSSIVLRKTVVWFWLGSLILGFQILSGGLPFVWLSLLLVGLYRLGYLVLPFRRPLHLWLMESAVLAAIIGIALCLAAVQLIPTYEFVKQSNRPFENYDYAASGSYDPEFLPTLLYAGASAPEDEHFWEYYGYMSLLAIMMAAVGLMGLHKDPRLIVLALIGVLTFLYMLGDYGFLFPILWKYVPSFSLFRVPARSMVILNYIIAIFAAVGLERILFVLKRKSVILLAWTLPVFLVLFAAAWVDITIAAKSNTDRLFLPDHAAMENPMQKLHENILIKDRSWYRFWFDFYYFRQNHAFALDRFSLGGYDNMFLKRYSRFIHYMTDTELDSTIITILPLKAPSNAPGPFPFKILGMKYADYDRKIFEQKDLRAIKRAWFVTRAIRVKDEESALEYMRSDQFKPFQEVVFEAPEAERLNLPLSGSDRPVLDPAPNMEIVVHEFSPEHLRVEIGPHSDGFLILSEIYYPGWHALMNEQSIPVYRANSILRCIPLKENIHQIDLRFQPASVYYGAIVSLASLLIVLVGLAFSSYWYFRKRQ